MGKIWYKCILSCNIEYFKLMFLVAYVPSSLRKIKLMIQAYNMCTDYRRVILVSIKYYTSILHPRS